MKYVEAPNYELVKPNECLFLAGSISNAPDWQSEILSIKVQIDDLGGRFGLLDKYNVFNPRRKKFDVKNPSMEYEQIKWEYDHIKFCKRILFWFAAETLAPITLFEYGKVLKSFDPENINVGVHPKYARKNDILIQTELECGKSIEIVDNLTDLVRQLVF